MPPRGLVRKNGAQKETTSGERGKNAGGRISPLNCILEGRSIDFETPKPRLARPTQCPKDLSRSSRSWFMEARAGTVVGLVHYLPEFLRIYEYSAVYFAVTCQIVAYIRS